MHDLVKMGNSIKMTSNNTPDLFLLFFLLFQLLSLDFVHKIKIGLVKMVDTDVTVFSARGISCTSWVDMDVIERSEVAPDTTDLVLEDLVVETSLEFTLAGGSCCDIHRSLTTSQDHIVLLGSEGSRVNGGVGDISFEDSKITAGHELVKIVSGIIQTLPVSKNVPWQSCP